MTGDPDLIEQYRKIHATTLYGNTSVKNLRFVRPEIRILGPRSILDYGCGQSPLLDALALDYPVELARYDPAIPAYSRKPDRVFDLLVNVDVLEHIEEKDLDAVLAEMRSLCRDAIIIVDMKAAKKLLADGRNAHVTLRSGDWWRNRIGEHFGRLEPIATARRSRCGFRTWRRSGSDTLRYLGFRAMENARYLAGKLSRAGR